MKKIMSLILPGIGIFISSIYIIMIFLGMAIAATQEKAERTVTCYAKAGLGIYDKHGVHEGYGDTIYQATASAMADCRSQHPFIGCVPLIGCK